FPSCASTSSSSRRHTDRPKDAYGVRAILPRPEGRGLPRTGSAPRDGGKNRDFVTGLNGCCRMQQLLVQRELEHTAGAQGFIPIGPAAAQFGQQVVRGAAAPRELLAAGWLQEFERTEILDGDHGLKSLPRVYPMHFAAWSFK